MIDKTKLSEMKKRIIFMGTPEFSVPILNELIEHYTVVSVITQPDRPAGRGRRILFSPVKQLAEKNGLMILQPADLKSEKFTERLEGIKPDLIIVAAFGKILPKRILEIPEYGCINVHASVLPRWRGASPIQTAILEGDETSGVTIMCMDENMDTGDILATFSIAISEDDTALSLSNTLSSLGAKRLIEILPKYFSGEIQPKPQNHENASYSKLISKTDGQLDFTENAEKIERRVRAFNPWPICYLETANRKIRIYKINISDESSLKPGETGISDKYPSIGTNSYDIILREVQPAGKQIMSGRNFLNGAKDWISNEK